MRSFTAEVTRHRENDSPGWMSTNLQRELADSEWLHVVHTELKGRAYL